MKVCFPPIPSNTDNVTGRIHFLKRLKRALKESSVAISFTGVKEADLVFSLSEPNKLGYGQKNVARMNGVYYHSEHDSRNSGIINHLKRCDAIIYQSKFSKQLVDRFIWRHHKVKNNLKETIIHNGYDLSFSKNIAPADSEYKYNAIWCAHWRRHKRLEETIQLALDVDDLCLWVIGEAKKTIKHKRIKYIGRINQEKLASYYKLADVTIHLCPYDNCPNAVVESIANGVPVLCTCSGGTPEIVGTENGIISQVEQPFDPNPIDVNNPPQIDMRTAAEDLQTLLKTQKKVNKSSVDIRGTALLYYRFFKQVLQK